MKARPGAAKARALWESHDAAVWASHLAPATYAARVARLNRADLSDLDEWMVNALPAAISARSPPHMTQPEISRLMTWKMAKGMWRPLLQNYVDAMKNDDVVQTTTDAFACLSKSDVKGAIKVLTGLKGIGPATASAVLSAADPSVPFMADEVLDAVLGRRDYTVPTLNKMISYLGSKATELSAAPASADAGAGAGAGAGASAGDAKSVDSADSDGGGDSDDSGDTESAAAASPAKRARGDAQVAGRGAAAASSSDTSTAAGAGSGGGAAGRWPGLDVSGGWTANHVQLALWSAASVDIEPRTTKRKKK